MFWKKKQMVATLPSGVVSSAIKTEVPPQPRVEKLPGPMQIPGFVGKHLIAECKIEPDLVSILKAVVRRNPKAAKMFDCRIFDLSEAEASGIRIKDYPSLDEHPELLLYEGWFDEGSKRVELQEIKKLSFDVPLLTETEIFQKIEALNEPGNTVFFYQARGPAVGGPLGRGAAIIELNPNYPEKKGKEYVVYTANVVGMEPVSKRLKLYESDKPKELARWVKESHHKRMY